MIGSDISGFLGFLREDNGNNIQNNVGPGVWLNGSGSGNYVLSNTLAGNGVGQFGVFNNGLEVDVNNLGQDANTFQGVQNYPIMRVSELVPTGTLAEGTLDAAPNTTYRLDFYNVSEATPLTYEGVRGDAGLFAGISFVTTDASGHCSFLLNLTSVSVLGWMSATASSTAGTSEISNGIKNLAYPDELFSSGFGPADGCQ